MLYQRVWLEGFLEKVFANQFSIISLNYSTLVKVFHKIQNRSLVYTLIKGMKPMFKKALGITHF